MCTCILSTIVTCSIKGQIRKNCTNDPRCARTCTNRFFFIACPLVCSIAGGCECPVGTVIDEDRNECVSSDKCPESMYMCI